MQMWLGSYSAWCWRQVILLVRDVPWITAFTWDIISYKKFERIIYVPLELFIFSTYITKWPSLLITVSRKNGHSNLCHLPSTYRGQMCKRTWKAVSSRTLCLCDVRATLCQFKGNYTFLHIQVLLFWTFFCWPTFDWLIRNKLFFIFHVDKYQIMGRKLVSQLN